MIDVNIYCRSYANSFARVMGFSADDIIQDACLKVADWVRNFDRAKCSWKTYLNNKFKYFCKDFARIKDNHRVCNFRHRNGKTVLRSVSTSSPINSALEDRREQTIGEGLEANADLDNEGFYQLLQTLSDRERIIACSYYIDGLSFKAISESVGISDSRISQIHTEIIRKLRGAVEL